MSLNPRMTMIGLYNYNSAVFERLNLPEGINKDDFINSFLLKYGECPVIYPQWEFMQFAVGVWSNKWYHSIERIIYAFTEDYNPLHNFDRHEEYTDTEDIDRATAAAASSTSNTSSETEETAGNTDSTENTVSAYNSDQYQPDNKSDSTGTANRNATGSITGSDTRNETGTDNTDRELQHNGHLYGNIGVTESTTMLLHEKELREKYSIIDIVCDMLYKEICIYIY